MQIDRSNPIDMEEWVEEKFALRHMQVEGAYLQPCGAYVVVPIGGGANWVPAPHASDDEYEPYDHYNDDDA